MKPRRSIYIIFFATLFASVLFSSSPGLADEAYGKLWGEGERWISQALDYLEEEGLILNEEKDDPARASRLALVRATKKVEQGETLSAPLQAVLFRLLLTFADELDKVSNPSLSPTALSNSFKEEREEEEKVEWEGYLDYQFLSHREDGGSSFTLPRLTLEIEGKPSNKDDLYIEIEWEDGGIEGGEEEGAVEIERARLDHQISPTWKLRAGALIIPVGFIGIHHEPYEIVGVSRPLLARQIIPTAWSELGIGLVGKPSNHLTINALVSQGLEDKISHRGIRSARPGLGEEEFSGKATTLHLEYEPTPQLTIGGSWYYSSIAPGSNLNHLSGYLKWEKKGYRLLYEYARANINRNPDQLAETPAWMFGWYLQGEIPLPGLTWGENGLPKLFARWGRVDTSSDPTQGRKRRLTVGLNLPLSENLTFKMEAQRNWLQREKTTSQFLASLVMVF